MTEDLSVLTRKATPAAQTLSYGEDPDQVADVRPGTRGTQLPLVVFIHGGFWKPQYDRAHAEALSSAIAAAGWTVLTLEYRRVPGHPDAMLQDVAAALGRLPAQVAPHRGQVLLMGHSAGGHLALWAAVTCAPTGLQGVLALAPAADLRLAHALHLGDGAVLGFLGVDPASRPDVDPPRLAAPTVPVTIVQGGLDEVVPSVVPASYCERFPATRLIPLPDSGHFAVIDPLSNAWPAVLDELAKLSEAPLRGGA